MSWRRFQSLLRGSPFELKEQDYLRGLSTLRSQGKSFLGREIEPAWIRADLDPEAIEDVPGGYVLVTALPRTLGFALLLASALTENARSPAGAQDTIHEASALHVASLALMELAAREHPASRDRLAGLYGPEELAELSREEIPPARPAPEERLLVAHHATLIAGLSRCRDLAGGGPELARRKDWLDSLSDQVRATLAVTAFPAGASARELRRTRARPLRHMVLITDLVDPAPPEELQKRLAFVEPIGELIWLTDDLFDLFTDLDSRRPNAYARRLKGVPSRAMAEARELWPGWLLELVQRYKAMGMALRGRPGGKILTRTLALYLQSEAAILK